MVSQHELIIPELQEEVDTTLQEVKSVLALVDRKMEKFQGWVSYVKPTDMRAEIPMEIVNSLNEVILDRSPSTVMESVCQRVEQLEGEVRVNRLTTDSVRSAMVQLQERVSNQSINTSEVGDTLHPVESRSLDCGSPKANHTARERGVVRKGIERMEKQIIQLISIFISREQADIVLLKKCKTVDVPAVNSAIGNIQRSLQKYMGFEGMESEFCDGIENLMDKAQTWCLNIEDLYNRGTLH